VKNKPFLATLRLCDFALKMDFTAVASGCGQHAKVNSSREVPEAAGVSSV
jgi:hypothetical protein